MNPALTGVVDVLLLGFGMLLIPFGVYCLLRLSFDLLQEGRNNG